MRTRRWTTALLCATGMAALAGCGGTSPTAAPAGGSEQSAAAWRTEYWHDVAVDVPADWWYGGGPTDDSLGPVACFPEPIVDPSGDRREGGGRQAAGWIGRPIALTDVCVGVDEGPPPEVPYLWFDAPVDPGSVDLGGGWTQETVEVNGSRITIATDDDALRGRILGTATGGEACFSELEDLDDPRVVQPRLEGRPPTVCAYRGSGGDGRLVYAATLSRQRAERFIAAFGEAPRLVVGRACDLGGPDFEWVVVHVGRAPYVVRTGFHGCPHVQRGERLVRLTPEVVEPWATGGIPAVVVGPTGGKGAMVDAFIGPLG
jgi:hypothetical protein